MVHLVCDLLVLGPDWLLSAFHYNDLSSAVALLQLLGLRRHHNGLGLLRLALALIVGLREDVFDLLEIPEGQLDGLHELLLLKLVHVNGDARLDTMVLHQLVDVGPVLRREHEAGGDEPRHLG